MPPTHAAFLRGINVGRAKRVAMADLRRAIESLGATDVRTLLNSGNVVLAWPSGSRVTASALAGRIEAAVESRLGHSAMVVVLTRAEVQRILDDVPAGAARLEPSRVLIGIPPSAGDVKKLAPLLAEDWSPERLDLGTRAACMGLPRGVADSRLVAAVEARLDRRVTSRNLATLRKVLDLMTSGDPGMALRAGRQ